MPFSDHVAPITAVAAAPVARGHDVRVYTGRAFADRVAGGDLDKPEVAARVAAAGAGVNLRTGRPSAAQVAAGYARVTSDASFTDAAASLAGALAELGGAASVAEHLEAFAAG